MAKNIHKKVPMLAPKKVKKYQSLDEIIIHIDSTREGRSAEMDLQMKMQ